MTKVIQFCEFLGEHFSGRDLMDVFGLLLVVITVAYISKRG